MVGGEANKCLGLKIRILKWRLFAVSMKRDKKSSIESPGVTWRKDREPEGK